MERQTNPWKDEKINQYFYPVPGKQVIDSWTGKVRVVDIINKDYLTRDEFPDIYDKCMRHRLRPACIELDLWNFSCPILQ